MKDLCLFLFVATFREYIQICIPLGRIYIQQPKHRME
jgi:hypothetical protein